MLKGLSEFSNTIIIATILLMALSGFIILNLVLFYFKRKKHLFQQSELKSQFKQTLLQSRIEIQEQTLQHISYELHDNIGQIASLITIYLNTMPFLDKSKLIEKIEQTKEITNQLSKDIKALSVSLGADRITKEGLINALETEVKHLNNSNSIHVKFTIYGNMPNLDPDKSVILYRMSQEILNNTIKHSHAKHLLIHLKVLENLFILEFKDDGDGFDLADKKQNGGAGLQNLENRAMLINAQLIIESTRGKGTSVTIKLPI